MLFLLLFFTLVVVVVVVDFDTEQLRSNTHQTADWVEYVLGLLSLLLLLFSKKDDVNIVAAVQNTLSIYRKAPIKPIFGSQPGQGKHHLINFLSKTNCPFSKLWPQYKTEWSILEIVTVKRLHFVS